MPPHHGAAAPVSSYSAPPSATGHGGYPEHNHPPASMDQYGSHSATTAGGYGTTGASQSSYSANGYGQNSYGSAAMASTGYAAGTEYDTSHYDYSTGTYDSRYQTGYSQDYSQSYGTTTDYSAVSTETYPSQQYDDRSTGYAGYDAQAYSQGYAKTDQYAHGGYY